MPYISLSFDVTKLKKEKFVKGKKGLYCDLVLWETPDSEYGDYMIKQRGDKDEKLPILGNAKIFKLKKENGGNRRREDDENDTDDSGIPF